ncbi:tyrosine-type recombinase/integrase [Roseovarius pacificus]|uniref:tyrosine-type recombinase/integrase n=1 Tax=Roseovarius pacificus TaxID=337701 RepID=UPI002A18D9C9|nr:tyrosine-type recombinase/integrase [Roseovarius pacificus]
MGQRHGGIRVKGVMRIRKGGRTYWYFRRRGHKLVNLPEPRTDNPADDPAFLEAVATAKRQTAPKGSFSTGTFGALCIAAKASDLFLGLSKDYRRVQARHIDKLMDEYGTLTAKGLRTEHINADLRKASDPRARRKAWRFICEFGYPALLDHDPSKHADTVKAKKTDGHPPWTDAEIADYRARWPTGSIQRLAFELLLWTGCRISDAVNLGPGMIGADGVLAFRQSKTGEKAYVPWTCHIPGHVPDPESRDALHATLSRGVMTYLETAQGRVRSVNGLGNMIREAASKAKVEKSAHGLRKSRAIRLAEGGATPHQIGSWTGHKTLSEISHYTDAMNRRAAVIGTEPQRIVQTNVQTGK